MKRYVPLFSGLLFTLMLAASVASAQDPRKTADVLTGNAKGAAADNPVCKLFSVADVSKFLGRPAGAGQNAALGSGCQWISKDEEADMLVQIVEARYHEEPSLAKGFQRLPDVGPRAFALPELGGWKAGTVQGPDAIVVTLDGPAANQQSVVALLKETLARRK